MKILKNAGYNPLIKWLWSKIWVKYLTAADGTKDTVVKVKGWKTAIVDKHSPYSSRVTMSPVLPWEKDAPKAYKTKPIKKTKAAKVAATAAILMLVGLGVVGTEHMAEFLAKNIIHTQSK